jgi:hypothetical protein
MVIFPPIAITGNTGLYLWINCGSHKVPGAESTPNYGDPKHVKMAPHGTGPYIKSILFNSFSSS